MIIGFICQRTFPGLDLGNERQIMKSRRNLPAIGNPGAATSVIAARVKNPLGAPPQPQRRSQLATKSIIGLTLLTVFGISFPLCAQELVTGVVKSVSGNPIADVLVCATTWWCAKTDFEGHYSLDVQGRGRILRFSRDGYKPVLEAVGDTLSGVDITLSASDQTPWVIPSCRWRDRQIGFNFKVVVPKGTQVTETSDAANTILKIRFESSGEWLTIGMGPTWDGGFPSKSELDSLEIVDRDLRLPSTYNKRDPEGLSLDGVDIRVG
jgi:hypothetical protein